jgi:GT2 family glycosyltransferase
VPMRGDDTVEPMTTVSVVIPNWNGRRWLPGCLAALAAQETPPGEVIVVDNGSRDGSLQYLAAEHPEVQVIALERNTGFAHAANRGIQAAVYDFIALVNTDVELASDWTGRMAAALAADPALGSVACKMVDLQPPGGIYDAGDVLRRDGACEQRGRFGRDDGSFDVPGEIFGACAGAALYRRVALLAAEGFDERYFAYLEDVDLAVALRRAGWRCRYEPVVAHHAGEGSSRQLPGGARRLVARNTLLLVAKWFPARWLPLVAYRQAAWLWHAARERQLSAHVWGLIEGAVLAVAVVAQRRRLRRSGSLPIDQVVPRLPIRGPAALGHPSRLKR